MSEKSPARRLYQKRWTRAKAAAVRELIHLHYAEYLRLFNAAWDDLKEADNAQQP